MASDCSTDDTVAPLSLDVLADLGSSRSTDSEADSYADPSSTASATDSIRTAHSLASGYSTDDRGTSPLHPAP